MKTILCFLCLIIFINSKAQNVSALRSQQNSPDGWVLLKDTANIQFSVKEVPCNGNSIFLIKIVNANSDAKSAKWSFWKIGDNEPMQELFKQSNVEAHNKVEGECPDASTMTVVRPLVEYLYGGATINNLVFKLSIN